MAKPRPLNSLQDLLALLEEDGVLHHRSELPHSVELPLGGETVNTVAVIRWQSEVRAVQVIVPIGVTLADQALPAGLDRLVRINHGLAIPGFGYDHGTRQLYYRVAIPIPLAGLMSNELIGIFRMATDVASRHIPVFEQAGQ